MKISLNWLKKYIISGLSTETLAHKLTLSGQEVEKIQKIGDDTLMEIEITPNRPDCLNLIGIAREISAITQKPLLKPKTKTIKFPSKKFPISIDDKLACDCYLGVLIEEVSVKSTPGYVKSALSSLGMKSINNIVDITNYCLLEGGQPFHAFDADKILGSQIIVRRAKKGEKIITLDNVERELDASVLVIADEKRPIAIAGIMGGKETEVTSSTKNILLESAHFNQVLIRQTSRKLGLSTDSSYRFERGVDVDQIDQTTARVLSLILDEAAGKITRFTKLRSGKNIGKPAIKLSIEEINKQLGSTLTVTQCGRILKKLEFGFKNVKNNMVINSPSFRRDIKSKVDIIEEIARIVGYDQLPMTLPTVSMVNIPKSIKNTKINRLRKELVSQGLNETVTFSLMNRNKILSACGDRNNLISISNPLSQDQEIMRNSILPSFLDVAQTNINRGIRGIQIFELGKIYSNDKETDTLAILIEGPHCKDWRDSKKNDVDFFDLKGIFLQVMTAIDPSKYQFTSQDKECFERGVSSEIYVGKNRIGFAGEVAKDILKQWNIKSGRLFYLEISLDSILNGKTVSRKFKPLVEYPSITRDLNVVVESNIAIQQIFDIISIEKQKIPEGILKKYEFCEDYRGEGIPDGKKSLVFSFEYMSSLRTLREEEVNRAHKILVDTICAQLDANIR